MAIELTIDLEWQLRRGLDTDMFTLGVEHVANGIDATIKEAAKAEDDIPPVQGADNSNIEQTVVSNSLRELLDTTTIILTYANGHTEHQVIVDQSTVNPYLSACGLVSKERPNKRTYI
jgi:hypothetical protein